MEIYYCQTCGIKIDSDAIASGEAARRGADQVFCRVCAIKEGVKFSSGKLPPHKKPPTQAAAPVARRLPPAVAASPAARPQSNSMGIVVLVVGVGILGAGAFFALKGREEPAKSSEPSMPDITKITPPVVEKPKPVVEETPPPMVDKEKAADEEYSALVKSAASRSPAQQAELLEALVKKYPFTFAGRRASVEVSRTKKVQKALADGFVPLASMEGEESWGFHPGSEFPGATGSMLKDKSVFKDGTQSLKMSGDFTGGGSYVSAGLAITGATAELLSAVPPERVRGLRLWVKSPVATIVGLRASGADDQCHQQGIRIQPKDEWQLVEFKALNKGEAYSHWGGKNDGVFRPPLRFMAFLINITASGPAKKADIWMDQVELVLDPQK